MGDRLRLLDQTRLPAEERYLELTDYRDVAAAISELKVRGAPAIGVAGAYGIALAALAADGSPAEFRAAVRQAIAAITATRPTARNLFWAAERLERFLAVEGSVPDVRAAIVSEAAAIHREEEDHSCRLSEVGAALVPEVATVLTICNTGPLATTGCGTAFGIIASARDQGKHVRVIVPETRPLLQGARLTAWELMKAGVPFTLITDSMAGYFFARGEIDCVIVGADRIAGNGDTANKIGTYTLAVLAHAHRVPFYVAAPTTTIDLTLKNGRSIPIEERRAEEVTHIRGIAIAPDGTPAANPAFDVTPNRYISAIITERGIIRRPYLPGLRAIRS